MKTHFSNQVSSFEAKTHFSQLLQRVKAGEKITILNHNHPVAKLVPIAIQGKLETKEAIANLTTFRKNKRLLGLTIKDLIIEGRK